MEGTETPTGTARAEAPGLSAVKEKAEAVPVESVVPVTEIGNFYMHCIKKKVANNFVEMFLLCT